MDRSPKLVDEKHTYLWTTKKWVGHRQEIRSNGSSLILGFGPDLTLIGSLKSGLDTFRNWDIMIPVLFRVLARKLVLTLIGPLKSGLEWRHNVLSQQGCRAARQVLHKSNLFLQHGCGATRQVLNEPNLCQQYGCRADCQFQINETKCHSIAAEEPAKF